MNKVIHIPLHFNDDVTRSDIGTNLKCHVLLGMTQISLQKSCPCGLEVLIFFSHYYLLHVKKVREKNPNNKKPQQPFCTCLDHISSLISKRNLIYALSFWAC